MIRLGVVAHEARYPEATKLADYVGAEVVSVDNGDLGCTGNHLYVWDWLLESPAEWYVVLEDDAIPVRNFRSELARALMVAPTPVVSLYLGRAKPVPWQEQISRVIAQDVSWLKASSLLHGVGYAVRGSVATHMVQRVKTMTDIPVDEAVSKWAQQQGFRVAHSRPSLVNHTDTSPVIVNRKVTPDRYLASNLPDGELRKAWMFGTRNWDSSSVILPSPAKVS